MASHQLVIVKEAQHLTRSLGQFEQYFKNPVPTTILVFCFKGKKIDKRKSIGKLLSKSNFLFDLELVKDYQLPDWILNCAKNNNLPIDSQAIVLLSEFLGNDLSEIEKNIQKLKLLNKDSQKVDADMVQKHIGFSKDYNLFELTDAIAAMNIQKAGFIAYHFGKNSKNHPIVVTIGHLYGFFTKLMKFHFYKDNMGDSQLAGKIGVHPFFLKQYKQASNFYSKSKLAQILSQLRHYDLMSKGVFAQNTSHEEILKEMIFKIMH
jgi:DNA polymerase-3 subunit delta